MRGLSIDELLSAHRNETPHTEHVATLALRLFDRLHAALRVPGRERRLLEAACRLHDIGFAANPDNHVAAGAELVMREGVRGFTPTQCQLLAAVILLHPRCYHDHLDHSIVQTLGSPSRACRLAAFLAVADGLDHAHAQNASLTSIRHGKGRVAVTVRSPGFPGNAHWAAKKAVLWNETFPLRMDIRLAPEPADRLLFGGIVRGRDERLEALRKLLDVQYRIATDNIPGTLAGQDPEPLHDLRVAMRRFRSALRMFRGPVRHTQAESLRAGIGDMSAALGPVRDSQVWLAFLTGPKRQRCTLDPDWPAYLATQRADDDTHLDALRGVLNGESFSTLRRRMACFLRTDLVVLRDAADPHAYAPFAATRILALYGKITREKHRLADMQPEALHNLRKRCRQLRYWSEFAAPALDSLTGPLARRAKDLADALGDVHDRDMHLARRAADSRHALPALDGELALLRARAGRASVKAWSQLRRKAFRRDVLREIAGAAARE